MSFASTHSLPLLSITPLIPIARSGVYITLDRQGSTYSPQTQSSQKGRPAQNEPAFSHLRFYRFPPLAHKKCLRTSFGSRFRTRAPPLLVKTIDDTETCSPHFRWREPWMTPSIYTLLDRWWHAAQKMPICAHPLNRTWNYLSLPVLHTHGPSRPQSLPR